MAESLNPLPEGTLIGERFLIQALLGRGGFGITYLATDTERRDLCVVKELAPAGVTRADDLQLSFANIALIEAQRLRHQFVNEAKLLARLHVRGILAVRAAFDDFGTSFYVTDYVDKSLSLQKIFLRDGRLSTEDAISIFTQLLEVLSSVHAKGILHRDIKPSNILVDPSGNVSLIDFGSAREWHSDVATRHTAEHTPGYAPIEQMSERARRGPGTDLFALCATMYEALAGVLPTLITDRVAGIQLIPLDKLRSDVPPGLLRAIHWGLEVRLDQRPQSCAALMEALSRLDEPQVVVPRFEEIDSQIIELRKLKYGKRECPSCHGILSPAVPLRPGTCLVCHEGTIRKRELNLRACPLCRVGILNRIANENPLKFCPSCRFGRLESQGFSFNFRTRRLKCDSCLESYVANGELLKRESDGLQQSVADWRTDSDRSIEVWVCDGCSAQFDGCDDDRREQVVPKPKPGAYKTMYPDEWARVAIGLDPTCGNAECEVCHSDFFLDRDTITVIHSPRDVHNYYANWGGQAIPQADALWISAGKESGNPGLVCGNCALEFDGLETSDLLLVGTQHPLLRKQADEIHSLEDWHRIARGLPTELEAQNLDSEMIGALSGAYEQGEIAFESTKPEVVWMGQAEVLDAQGIVIAYGTHPMHLTADELQIGGMLKKIKLAMSELIEVDVDEEDDGAMLFVFTNNRSLELLIHQVELDVRLPSRRWTVPLDSTNLLRRLMQVTAQS